MFDGNTSGETQPAQGPWLNRRATVRYRCTGEARGRVFLADSYRSLAAEVRDLSTGGAGLTLRQPLEAGALLYLELENAGQGLSLELLARVVHASAQASGAWHLGCEFVNQLSPEELRTLLKTSPSGGGSPEESPLPEPVR